ncbi:MAG: 3-hydroxybutyryl-CoA dehydrogenase [Ignavibacteriae bacterium]|nr:3-hydroxybutyryl-CoA dehydrogenase [Ignavibacteriota bacterium]
MNLLFTGPAAIINDWISVCESHTCHVYSRDAKKTLSKHAHKIDALDDVRDLDLVFNFHVGSTPKRQALIDEIVTYTGGKVPVLCNTVAVSATEVATWTRKPACIIGVGALPGLLAGECVEVAFPHGNTRAHEAVLRGFIESVGKTMEVVADEVGLVFPRVLCSILNEALFALQQGVATEEDIETSMKLAVNYPRGPFEWGALIGWRNVYTIVTALHTTLGDDRYRPAPLLRKLALSAD